MLPVLRRHGMCPEIRGNHRGRQFIVQLLQDMQQTQFCIAIQSIAALSLYGRDANGEHSPQDTPAMLHQFCFTCPTCLVHRGDNTAATLQKRQIGYTGQAVIEFLRTGTGKQEMRMRIDKPRNRALTAAVNHLTA